MTTTRRHDDPFPSQGRYRHAYEPDPPDPFEIELARREAREAAARERVKRGHTPDATPEELRGIPVQAKGVSGASPGSRPGDGLWRLDER